MATNTGRRTKESRENIIATGAERQMRISKICTCKKRRGQAE
jgi:hypothetical protein